MMKQKTTNKITHFQSVPANCEYTPAQDATERKVREPPVYGLKSHSSVTVHQRHCLLFHSPNSLLTKRHCHFPQKRSPPTLLSQVPAAVRPDDNRGAHDLGGSGALEFDEMRTRELHAEKASGCLRNRDQGWPAGSDGGRALERLLGEGDQAGCRLGIVGSFCPDHREDRIAVPPDRGSRMPKSRSKALVCKGEHPRPWLHFSSSNPNAMAPLTFLFPQDCRTRRPWKKGM